jgi:hypothetical protein
VDNESRLMIDGLFHYLEQNATDEDLRYFQQTFSIKPPKARGETHLRSHQPHVKRSGRGGARLTPDERFSA